MTWWQGVLLVAGGFTAGVINTIAGAGSMLTVPLLVLAGVPGNAANGSNRVGILTSNGAAIIGFRRLGVSQGGKTMASILAPVVAGSLVGSVLVSRIPDDVFEMVFGALMVPLVVLSVITTPQQRDAPPWRLATTAVVFFGIGLYGGAIQAGVGLLMLVALTRSGFDLVTANAIKVTATFVVTVIALPVFIITGDVRWGPALLLAAGFTIGGWKGAQVAVRAGVGLIRGVMIVAAIALAARLLGLY